MHEARLAHDLQPRRALVDEEEGLLSLGVGEDDVKAGQIAAGDEPLVAIQHPLIAVANGGSLDAGHVGAGARLGDGPRFPRLAARHCRHSRCHANEGGVSAR